MKQKLEPALVPFAGFFATLPLYSPNMATLAERLGVEGAAMGQFAVPLLATCLACSIAFVAAGLHRGDGPWLSRLVGTPAGAILYLGGFALLVFDALQHPETTTWWPKCIAGLMTGAGTTLVLASWLRAFSTLDIRRALFHLALTCGTGTLAALGFATVAGIPYLVGFFILAAAGAIAPSTAHQAIAVSEETANNPKRPPVAAVISPFQTTAQLGSIAGAPLLGLAFFGLTMSMRKFRIFDTYDIELAAGIIAAILAAIICTLAIRRPFLSFCYQEFLPACALILMVCSTFPVGSAVHTISAMLMYVVFAVVGLFALASLVAVVHAGEFSPALVLGVALGSYAIASFGGVVLGQILPEDSLGPTILVASSLYFAVLIMAAILSLSQSADGALRNGDGPNVGALIQQRCEKLAQEFSLSPREQEILGYLARGHNPTYVSRELVLSLSTVRTHIRNLYKKIGVSSQEELIALVDEGDEGNVQDRLEPPVVPACK